MSAAAPAVPSTKPRFQLRREWGLALLLLIILVDVGRAVEPDQFIPNLLRVLRDQSHLGVLAVGMTLVILTGGIDLSVGSIVALAGVSMGVAWKATGSGYVALLTALLVGGLCGLANGALYARGRVPPLIVTLATLSIYRGLAFAVGGSQSVGRFPDSVLTVSRSNFLGLPVPVWITAAIMVGAGLYLARTSGGRTIYAVGANAAASRLSGVPVNTIRLRLYALSGLLAGLAATLYAARNNSVRADIGAEYELQAITIVVLGGTSVSGGEGSILGTVLGFLTLILLQNDMALRRLPAEYHGIAVAFLLIGALLLDAGFRRRLTRA